MCINRSNDNTFQRNVDEEVVEVFLKEITSQIVRHADFRQFSLRKAIVSSREADTTFVDLVDRYLTHC